jgi:hypothetical protein
MDWFFDWGKVSDLPPVRAFLDWFLGLGLWDWGLFGWLGEHAPFQDRLPLFFLTATVILGVIGQLIWHRVMVMRAKQIGFDETAATIWQTGPREGLPKQNPVNLDRARMRQISWPLLGLPLSVIAIGMWVFFLAYPVEASWQLFALLWFVLAPIRKVWGMWVARKAFRVTRPDHQLNTTLLQDVRDYYQTGVAGASSRLPIEPGFEESTWFGRTANWIQMNLRPKSALYWLGRFFSLRWVPGVVIQLFLAWIVPVSAVIAPFWYMKHVEDYRDWMRPWWRWNRDSETPNRIVRGEVVNSEDHRPDEGPSDERLLPVRS